MSMLWRPIASAPKDGTIVYGDYGGPSYYHRGRWRGPASIAFTRGRWRDAYGTPGTWAYWMPVTR